MTIRNPSTQSQSDKSKSQSLPLKSSEKNGKNTGKTRITVKYDVGYHNALYIRGNGGNLSWSQGLPLKNINADEWIWESDASFPHSSEFKILINDRHYELGANHSLSSGSNIQLTPRF